ncbi:Hypothetical predicted protein [Marmota monax]|uniref:G-protein coupled receptors family 1 profile domain-containing protein n=1 Tax=Marmota monax TaxID=9995 RepID=A0A5E4D8L6_MARMO|nr:hypothetical protein GHT09_005168 [Marmota monax]VTJ90070.1 Hypothetical predicted protein [Marmota monax]
MFCVGMAAVISAQVHGQKFCMGVDGAPSVFVVTEGFVLAAMAYDHFSAICNPLLYSVYMSRYLHSQLVPISVMGSVPPSKSV